ncbi:Por secretion system C-terminal sorting domain-containing protein [Fibrobacter sp. UWT3]|uniref:glycosyl hydrolase n=1 Tax=Fibrobacter sp. UWT3 TaxID=1896225 RepID=UPI000BD9BEB7|nr:glycosyl hydrolase [Fibrobacter sp. UWT3]SOE76655.1 Por secretion system C-terminal sorting domain-containing protein [Fibrobacter sp. UWT3]
MKITKFAWMFGLAAAVSASAAVSATPVTEGATEGAQKLYNFLAMNYGVKTVSGVMTGDVSSATVKELPDVISFQEHTGKLPALVGFDFLFATGVKASDSWYQSYTQMALDAAKDLWSQGGIPAFTWHWKDPSDQIDAFYTKSGNDKEYTEFDFTKGFADPACTANCTWNKESETYKQLVSDIDEIADMFLGLQEAGVAAIFRPLHEASGKWFWWGTKGGAAFQALYNLVYDEMVGVKGVKNLVWVWNPEYTSDKDWNPGATKYDVISLDIYEAWDYTTKYTKAYTELTTNYGTDKILAVSENGSIPDMSAMKAGNTVWSWWMPWYQTWDGKFLDQTVEAVWKANMESPCTIDLESMPGWDKYTISTTPVAACEAGYKLGDLDTARVIEEVLPGDMATNGWLQVKLAAGSDTAKGNIVILDKNIPDLSTAKTLTMKVYNTNSMSGIWFTVAFLTGAPDWAWAQPEGCWVNAGDSTLCEIDLTTTAKDQVVLEGADYTAFMGNISKVYLEVFAAGFNGTVYYDDVTVDGSILINNFDKKQTIKVEQGSNLTATVIPPGTDAVKTVAASAAKFGIQGNTISLSTAKSGMVSVDVFGLNGKRVATLYKGNLAAGSYAFSLENMPKGSYIVRVKGAGIAATKPVLVK